MCPMCEIHNLKHSLNTGYIETQSKEQNNCPHWPAMQEIGKRKNIQYLKK